MRLRRVSRSERTSRIGAAHGLVRMTSLNAGQRMTAVAASVATSGSPVSSGPQWDFAPGSFAAWTARS